MAADCASSLLICEIQNTDEPEGLATIRWIVFWLLTKSRADRLDRNYQASVVDRTVPDLFPVLHRREPNTECNRGNQSHLAHEVYGLWYKDSHHVKDHFD